MVQHSVPVDAHAVVVSCLAQLDELLFGSPFGGDAAFLVELAKIVEVIEVIAVALLGRGFAAEISC